MRPIPEDTLRFVRLCVPLTGFAPFDLHATGMAQLYLDTARQQVGRYRLDTFLTELTEACTPLLDPSELSETDREIARAITYLWYTGAWPKLAVDAHADLRREMANTEFVVAPSTYVEGLVWRTFQSHPVGAKPPGFGTWGREPAELPPLTEIVQECGLAEQTGGSRPEEESTRGERSVPGGTRIEPHMLPGPRVARDVPPSALPTARAPRSERNTA
ncbi:hypothetical protein [Nocardiopsis xinjiangensis]|uniref:hypothetical protein n=1 Tax=Nocardiopsis xinjiangensis TaxID=124285 RepID=UPI00034BB125|nr:hypothetical protein [Nocardiopsis xinjiangensis]